MGRGNENRRLEAAGIAVLLIAITLAHYLTSAHHVLLHDVYRRLYYVPIVWAAIRFGLKGGLAASLAASVAFLPHIFYEWGNIPLMTTDALFEIFLYNAIAAVTGLLVDSERRNRDRLAQADLALLRSDQMKQLGEIAAGMAHEIRNPLASLRGGIELLGKETATNEDRGEVVRILAPELERIERAVRNFVTFARPEEMARQRVDVGEVAGEVVALLSRGGFEKVEFGLDIGPGNHTVTADLTQIRSVIMNLALNAAGAIDGPGRVDIRIGREGNDVVLQVKDSGRGVSPEIAGRIFEPFFTTRKDGLGLGLSIVKRVVEDQGGSIGFISKPGEGSTFEVRLKGEKA